MLGHRIVSTLIMLPPIVAVTLLGSPVLDIVTAMVTILMAWEWDTMVRGQFGNPGQIIACSGAIAVVVSSAHPFTSILLAIGGAILAGFWNGGIWLVVGAFYIITPCLALVWLRSIDSSETLLWLFSTVWATDIGAYSAGKLFRGPLLAPSISPSKTWAGVIGGLAAAITAGGILAIILSCSRTWNIVAASIGISVIAQVGDLIESKIKRNFGVKDSSRIIPGHGGILDRVDGLLIATPIVVGVVLASGGGVLLWGKEIQ